MVEIVLTSGNSSSDHPFSKRKLYTALAVKSVYEKVVLKLDSAWLCGVIISTISDNSFGFFSSTFGFFRIERSLMQTILLLYSFMPSSTVDRLHPNTSSATRGLPSRRAMVISPIAERLVGHGILSIKRVTNSTTFGDTSSRAKVDVFIFNASKVNV